MTNQKPIELLPSRELAQQWSNEWWDQRDESPIGELLFVATKAAQWGFNQRGAVNEAELQKARDEELEACDKAVRKIWQMDPTSTVDDLLRELRAVRRPKPKSQAEEALEALERTIILLMPVTGRKKVERLGIVRAALERLRELEGRND